MRLITCALLACVLMLTTACTSTAATLVKDGRSNAVIVVPASVMAPDVKPAPRETARLEVENQRTRLRESVKDLSLYIEKMSGAKVEIVNEAPAPGSGDKRVAILVGDPARAKFGAPKVSQVFKQGFRVVVNGDTVGLIGESDLATSYAIYEVLHRLGCRWFMPSDTGEYVPRTSTIALEPMDYNGAPYTYYRTIWYCDDAYRRRNRMGGLYLAAGHALEMYLTKEDREKHPEFKATVNGKPHPHRLKWSAKGLDEAIANKIIEGQAANPQLTWSLSPDDGLGYDDSPEDKALDAGDFDPSMQDICLTDRLMWLCNRIATRVNAKYPDVRFGMLAYVPYSRPPVREKIHPSIVPQIAPITFARAHPMHDDGEPNNKDLRYIVEGWGKVTPATSYYFYGWFLAELSGPNPMIKKWSEDIPYVYEKGSCKYWQPETLTNFETSVHALYLGNRMAWDPKQKPADIIQELNTKLYGQMSKEMTEYWNYIDWVWYGVPEYSGCGFGHMRRWSPERLAKSRELMNKAVAAAKTDQEKSLAAMYSESLSLFELFMELRRDQADGKFAGLDKKAQQYLDRMAAAVEKYKAQYAFSGVGWAGKAGVNGNYFAAFYQAPYDDAARIARDFQIVTPTVRQWRYMQDKEKKGEAAGWAKPELDDKAWNTTDVCIDTWSALGMHNYMGSVWYRQNVNVPAQPAGKKAYLWIGSTDGEVKVFVNGKHVPYVGKDGKTADAAGTHCQPVSFDITAALKPGDNQISLLATRNFLNELGTGGLLAAPIVYREK